MATEETGVAIRNELSALSDYGATLAELLDYLGEQDRQLRMSGLSEDQDEELQLYCWALHKRKSSGALWGQSTALGGVEDDIGA
jgi:hypothetical protein